MFNQLLILSQNLLEISSFNLHESSQVHVPLGICLLLYGTVYHLLSLILGVCHYLRILFTKLIRIYLHGINVLMFCAFIVHLCILYILLCDVSVAYGPLSQINWTKVLYLSAGQRSYTHSPQHCLVSGTGNVTVHISQLKHPRHEPSGLTICDIAQWHVYQSCVFKCRWTKLPC